MANSARLGLTASLCQDLLPGGWYNHDDNYPTRSRFEPSISGFRAQTGPNKLSGSAAGNRANTKHLYNISTTSAQRLRRWSNLVQMLYKCSVFTGKVSRVSTIDQTTKIDQSIRVLYLATCSWDSITFCYRQCLQFFFREVDCHNGSPMYGWIVSAFQGSVSPRKDCRAKTKSSNCLLYKFVVTAVCLHTQPLHSGLILTPYTQDPHSGFTLTLYTQALHSGCYTCALHSGFTHRIHNQAVILGFTLRL